MFIFDSAAVRHIYDMRGGVQPLRGPLPHEPVFSGWRMTFDFAPYFAEYKAIRAQADMVFEHVSTRYASLARCRPGCSDCCHALFDLSLIEAMYINSAFARQFAYGPQRSAVLDLASRTDRALTKMKRELFQAEKAGASGESIMADVSAARMRCPLLGGDGHCVMYEERPITCRLYGVPQEIGGKSHVCGVSGFRPGENYPAVHVGKIQAALEDLSRRLAEGLGSRYDLTQVYVPLSMALLTRYDDAYLGVGKPAED